MKYRNVVYKPITDDQIKSIAISCVDSDGLRLALDEAAEQFIYDHYDQQKFHHSDLGKRLEKIEQSAARLLLALKVDDSFEMESILNVRLGGKLVPLIQQIDLLKTVAHDASCEQAKQKAISKSRHSGDLAFNTLFKALSSIYMETFLLLPGFTMNGGDADGMFAEFIVSALDCISGNLSDSVKTSDPCIVQSLKKSHNAIRAQWNRVKSSLIFS